MSTLRTELARKQEEHADTIRAKMAWYRKLAGSVGSHTQAAISLTLEENYDGNRDTMENHAYESARQAAHFALLTQGEKSYGA